jgi:Domain of unknown function (DUF4186)
MNAKGSPAKLKPLQITCTSSDCGAGLHCFKKSHKMAEVDRGKCRSCGIDLIDWERLHRRDLSDVTFTFEALKYEMVRHHYWHQIIDQRALNHARRKGRVGLQIAARRRLVTSVGPSEPMRDGYQTPLEGNVIYYAQHAVACCCRKCIEYWHGIPQGEALTESQIDYLADLVMQFVADRIPDLADKGVRVPFIQRVITDAQDAT